MGALMHQATRTTTRTAHACTHANPPSDQARAGHLDGSRRIALAPQPRARQPAARCRLDAQRSLREAPSALTLGTCVGGEVGEGEGAGEGARGSSAVTRPHRRTRTRLHTCGDACTPTAPHRDTHTLTSCTHLQRCQLAGAQEDAAGTHLPPLQPSGTQHAPCRLGQLLSTARGWGRGSVCVGWGGGRVDEQGCSMRAAV